MYLETRGGAKPRQHLSSLTASQSIWAPSYLFLNSRHSPSKRLESYHLRAFDCFIRYLLCLIVVASAFWSSRLTVSISTRKTPPLLLPLYHEIAGPIQSNILPHKAHRTLKMKRSREPEEHLELDPQQGESHRLANADVNLRPVSKIAGLDSAAEGEEFVMRCSLPPHREPLGFRFYDDYETHYHKFHTNRCIECRKNFPTDHLLGVHIEECHDPLARVAREKGEHTVS